MAKTLTINTADLMGSTLQFPEQFPEFIDPFLYQLPEYTEPVDFNIMASLDKPPVHKLVEEVSRTPGRQPSPQPTHFSVPYKNGNGNGHRVLRSATVGYIAPEFKGKKAQMLEG